MKIDSRAIAGIAGKFFSEMDKAIAKSEKEGVECGFGFCKGKEVYITELEKGGRYYITKKAECKMGDKRIGDFHTHPKGPLYFSCGDISYALYNGLDFMCIGAGGSETIIKNGEEEYPTHCVKCVVIDQDLSRRLKYRPLFTRLRKIEWEILNVMYERPQEFEKYRDIYKDFSKVRKKLFEVAEKYKFLEYRAPVRDFFDKSERIVGEEVVEG